jgi:hypothetical protein
MTETLSLETRQTPKTSYLDTRVTNSQPTKRKRRSLARSERAVSRLETKKYLIGLATEIGEYELAAKLVECHSKLALLTCGRHVSKLIPNATCEFRLCPDCARRRSHRLQKKYVPYIEPFVQKTYAKPVMLTLTQKHRAETLKQSVDRLMSAFRKLIRRKFWKKHFKGGMWSLEFTLDKNGQYHTHLHILAFRSKFFDVRELREQWKEITGDSHVLRLDAVDDLQAGTKEILKYAVKPLSVSSMTAGHLEDFMKMKGARFVGTFGEFREFCKTELPDALPLTTDLDVSVKDLSEGCACPVCDEPLFELRMNGRELPVFLRSIETANRPPGKNH